MMTAIQGLQLVHTQINNSYTTTINHSTKTYMETTEIATQKLYTQDNEPAWLRKPFYHTYKLEYRSNDRNVLEEPVFYKTEQATNLIYPVLKPKFRLFQPHLKGYFTAYPDGLTIDPNTGEIDVNASNTGVRYTIGFISDNKKCIARTTIVMAGISFEGGIFSLSDPQQHKNSPVFYGDKTNSKEVPSRDALSGSFYFIPPGVRVTADLQGLVIDKVTGVIDYAETIRTGGLGFKECGEPQGGLNYPENGTCKEFTIFYDLKLSGSGKGIIQKTTVRIYFFNTINDIPDDLQLKLSFQKYIIHRKAFPLPLLLATSLYLLPDSPWGAFGALVVALSSLLFLNLPATTSTKPSASAVTK